MRTYIQKPLISIAMAACVGSALGCEIQILFHEIIFVMMTILLIIAYTFRKRSFTMVIILITVVFLFWVRSDMTLRWQDTIKDMGARRSIVVKGEIQGFPTYYPEHEYWVGNIDCKQMEYQGQTLALNGKIHFSATSPLRCFYPNQSIVISGRLDPIEPPMNPGEFDYLTWMQRQGISMRIKGEILADPVDSDSWFIHFWMLIAKVRSWIEANIQNSVSQNEQPFILAVTTGNRQGMDIWQRERLSVAGLAHIIAISGMHAGIIFLVVFYLAGFFGLKERMQLLLGLITIAVLVLITGFKIPILRSFVMLSGVTISSLFYKKGSTASGIALAILVLIFIYPCSVYDIGFQLSVIATIFIVSGMVVCQEYLQGKNKFLKLFISTGIVSGVSLVGTLPLVIFHFYQISPWSVCANLLAVPLIGIIVIFGFLSGVLGFLPGIGKAFGLCASFGVQGIYQLSLLIHLLPWSRIFCWRMPISWVMGYYLIWFSYYLIKKNKYFDEMMTKKLEIAIIFVVCIWIILIRILQPHSEYKARVTFLSLNIGEATLVETESGKTILIDTGTEQDFFWRIKPFLAHKGINQLDAVILSHSDFDHAGGIKACVSFFKVKTLLYGGGKFSKQDSQHELENWIKRKKTRVIRMGRNQDFSVSENIKIHGLWPPNGKDAQCNEECLAVILTLDEIKMLFPGDAPAVIQQQWELPRTIDLYKIAHHGDAFAYDVGSMTLLQPKVSVVMPGNKNVFGLPDDYTLQQVSLSSERVFNTLEQGAVEINYLNGKSIRWRIYYRPLDKPQPIAGGEKI